MELAPIELEHGQRFNKLTVIRKISSKDRGPKYECRCVCAGRIFAKARQLMKGEVTQCLRCDKAD